MSLLKRNIPVRQMYIKVNSLHIPSQITMPFLADVMKWERCSGIDWTVDRLKSIKQDLINYYNKSSIPVTPWVRRSRDKNFNGYFGQLFKYSIQSFFCFKKGLTLLNIYTSYIFEIPRENVEVAKFIKAVTSPGKPTPSKYLSLIEQAGYRFRSSSKPKGNSPFELCLTTPNRESRFMAEPYEFFMSTDGISTYNAYKDLLNESMGSFLKRDSTLILHYLRERTTKPLPSNCIGEIHCTPNPGLKARFFASPHLWLQHALTPLGNLIYDKVNSLPWDCTFDQLKADHAIQTHLLNESQVHCFDLTSATDRFPFDLQLQALRAIFIDKLTQTHINFYEHMQSLPYEFLDSTLTWARGQALGMYPSFGTFTLTHGLLLFALNNFTHDDKFFVLGDDVIILDDQLAKSYALFLQECDIAFSPHKTIVSTTIAEFAGMLYSKTDKQRIPKWKPLSKQNCLEQIEEWGSGLIDILPKGVKTLVSRVASLPKPYGCGLNPSGLSLDERFLGFEEIFAPKEKDLGFATNFKAMVTRRFLGNQNPLCVKQAFAAIHNAEILDQRIQAILKEFNLFIPGEISGKNLYTLDSTLSLPLSIVGKQNRDSHRYWSSNLLRFFNLSKDDTSL
jgi:hypothetical protein